MGEQFAAEAAQRELVEAELAVAEQERTDGAQSQSRSSRPAQGQERVQELEKLYDQQVESANKAHSEVAMAREELASIVADMDQRHDEHDAEIAGLRKQLAAAEEQFAAEAAQRELVEAGLAVAEQERIEQQAVLNTTQTKLRSA